MSTDSTETKPKGASPDWKSEDGKIAVWKGTYGPGGKDKYNVAIEGKDRDDKTRVDVSAVIGKQPLTPEQAGILASGGLVPLQLVGGSGNPYDVIFYSPGVVEKESQNPDRPFRNLEVERAMVKYDAQDNLQIITITDRRAPKPAEGGYPQVKFFAKVGKADDPFAVIDPIEADAMLNKGEAIKVKGGTLTLGEIKDSPYENKATGKTGVDRIANIVWTPTMKKTATTDGASRKAAAPKVAAADEGIEEDEESVSASM